MRTPDKRRPRRLAAPLAPVAVAFAIGILLDRFGPGIETAAWLVVAGVAGLVATVRPSGLAVVVAFAALGGARHHLGWTDLDPDDLARVAWSPPRPAWIRGAITEGPEFRRSSRPDEEGSTSAIVAVTAISDGRDWRVATGRVQLFIVGNRSDLDCGQPIFAAGSLGAIAGPRNPGETDRRDQARAEGVRLRMTVGESFSLWPDPEGATRPVSRWLGVARRWSRDRLISSLDPEVAPLGVALLLGDRAAVDPDINDAFARTGTTHLLAISGLHMQVLAWFVLVALRAVGLRRKPSLVIVAVATIAYALLVGLAPSVFRSAIMTLIFCIAGLFDRCGTPGNALAVAALATLGLNPAYLFDAGCQLSFLCVAALFWLVVPAYRFFGRKAAYPRFDPNVTTFEIEDHVAILDRIERAYEPPWKKFVRRTRGHLALNVVASVVVWLAAEPLVQAWFRLCAPVATLLNLPLIPLTSLALLAAVLTLLLSLIWMPLAAPAAWVCNRLLVVLQWAVKQGVQVGFGHVFVPGPSLPWLIVFYGSLALFMFACFRGWRHWRWLAAPLALEAALMTVAMFLPARPESLEADVLAVDHGLAVVIQDESGRVVLYDCGKMRDPRVGRRIIAPALWSRGVMKIDSVILSHADSDHFNGLPDLLDRFAVGEVRIPSGFGGSRNPEAVKLLDLLRSRGVPIREVAAGDVLELDGGRATILHPPREWLPGAVDNARSVVVELSARDGGPGLLLTGDLDGPGLTEVVSHPREPGVAMLAPHHGGRSANPEWLYRWAGPSRVIVSQKRPSGVSRDPLAALASRAIPIDRTWDIGAVRLAVGPARADRAGRSISAASFSLLGERATWTLVGVLAGLAAVLVLAVVEWGAWTLVMPGRRLAGSAPEPPPWEPIEVKARDGVRLHGAWLASDPHARGTASFLHGFGEDRAAMLGRAGVMAAHGWHVAVLDTRGRGRSEGDRTAFGGREAEDLHAWLDLLAADGLPVVAWGRSMGAAIAARAAVEDARIAAVILEAPYADLRDAVAAWIGRMHLPGFFAGPILWRAGRLAGVSLHDPRPIDVAPRVRVPVLVLHGTDDPIISVADARRLASSFAGPVEIIEVPGARHGDVFDRGGEDLATRIGAWVGGSRQ